MKGKVKCILFNAITFFMLAAMIIAITSNKVTFASSSSKTVTLSQSKVNNLNIGDVATISLESNPTTGYDWYVTYSKTGALNLVSNDFKASKNNIPGAGGVRTFIFKAMGSGDCTLTFKYYRFFEGVKADTKTIVYKVKVLNDKSKTVALEQGKKNTINVGDLAKVTLESNPTTGYYWYESYSKKGILNLVSNDYVVDSNLIGAGGKQTFTFKGVAKGDCTIILKYYRSFEGENKAIKVVSYNVKVK